MNLEAKVQNNADARVVGDFGREWKTLGQEKLKSEELKLAFNEYFHILPLDLIDTQSEGCEMGCGSGRWAKVMAPKVGKLHRIDPSDIALERAEPNLISANNCRFECASVADSTIANGSQDFGYCLGVLHHRPNTGAGLRSRTQKLKKGAPVLLYLYDRFDNKPAWFRLVWRMSDVARRFICRRPFPVKLFVSQVIACVVYWPLSVLSRMLEALGFDVRNIPLSSYRGKPFYSLRTDALDRFGTKLEKRFTKAEIGEMMTSAGLSNIRFSDRTPYWVAVGIKTEPPYFPFRFQF